MGYLWLKALHLTAVVTWIGGMLMVAIMLSASGLRRHLDLLERVRTWDQRVTTPAMLLAWILGLALALMGHWFPQGWLLVKLVFVLSLSGLHGMLAGRLRRMSWEQAAPPTPGRFGPAAGIVLMAAVIIVIVVTKPHAY